MILLLAFLYLVLCLCTETFAFNPKWGLYVLLIGSIYDVIMMTLRVCDRDEK